MKNKVLDLLLFVICAVCLVISLYLLWNMGIYVDEHNTSLDVVCGGKIGLWLYWGRIFLLFGASVLSGVKLFKKNR